MGERRREYTKDEQEEQKAKSERYRKVKVYEHNEKRAGKILNKNKEE